jgi:DHA1 family bicyclomycin/chloramphenicol resistance-like MFS transporter
MGTLQLSTGAAVIALVSALYDGTSVSMVSAIFVCACVALTLSFRTMKLKRVYP